MRTAFLAHGPLFKKGYINEPVLITDVYILLRQMLCLSPFSLPTNNLVHIGNMLDLTSLSNTCTHLYLSSINMIKSVSIKPINQNIIYDNEPEFVFINITERQATPRYNFIQMRVIIK
ncbi:unnamed protein product [Adineta steineri]|uniref:Uncharacterized protein n=1 Tax=Adineta steineri TaxID=433720 RepID=A0A820RHT7_9BILA|nr:unnamed protein product [Adineta steineri]